MRAIFPMFVLALAGLLPNGDASAAGVSGHFTVGDKRLEPRHAAAVRVRDPFTPRNHATYVVLSESPFDAASAAAELDPRRAIANAEALREGGAIYLTIADAGSITSNAQFEWTGTQYANSTRIGEIVGEFTTRTPERIAGRVRYAAPVPIDGVATLLDVSFDVPVLSAPRGTALPAGGGDAGKAFLAFAAAVEKADLEAAMPWLSAAQAPRFEKPEWKSVQEHADESLEALAMWLLKQPKVTGGESFDDRAVLDVEGEKSPGARYLQRVRMVREGGAWRYDESADLGRLRD